MRPIGSYQSIKVNNLSLNSKRPSVEKKEIKVECVHIICFGEICPGISDQQKSENRKILQQIDALHKRAFSQWDQNPCPSCDIICIAYSKKGGRAYVCTAKDNNNDVIGYSLTMEGSSTSLPEIKYLAVDPKHQGSGVGRRILEKTIETLSSVSGALGIELSVPSSDIRRSQLLKKFYNDHGFVAIRKDSDGSHRMRRN